MSELSEDLIARNQTSGWEEYACDRSLKAWIDMAAQHMCVAPVIWYAMVWLWELDYSIIVYVYDRDSKLASRRNVWLLGYIFSIY